jgi:ATP-dependent protease ClpP protease subunit
MKTEQFKYVVGEANSGEPAYMRFYGRIDEYSARNFNDEFLWLQDYVKPSKIIISINSEGGSVLHGMGTYSIIQNSPIETETIIEGLAASMGSVLWAAGTRSYMRDYSILMIHNPFLASDKCKTQDKCKPEDGCKPKCKCKPKCEDDDEEDDDDDNRQMIEAFRKQIETIYTKRFGLSQDKVREIMEGKKGCDGTYFDAKQAVKAGIIPASNVIKTSKQVCTKVKNQIEGLVEASEIQEMMASINAELCGIKPLENASSIPNKNQIQNFNSQAKMNEQEIAFGSVCAQLGLETTAGIADVVNSINALKETAKKLTDIQGAYDALKIQKEGLDAQLTNVKDELTTVKAELQTYKDAEKAQHDAEIAQFVDTAIADGKIKAEAKSMWVEMAQTNFEMVKNTLNSIDKQEKISEKIATNPANVQDAANGMTEAEKRMQAAVAEIVGADFQFNTLD